MKIVKLVLALCFVFFVAQAHAQAPVITNPSSGATGVSLTPTITFTSNSTGNSGASPDNMLIEISQLPSFDMAQGSPAYQRFFWYQKATNTLSTYNWSVPASLPPNTTYYARVRSTKNGYSTVISFTTNSTSMAPVVTVPTNGATGVSLTPTITFTSNSTGNSASSPDNMLIEISQLPSFDAAQGSPAYQSFFWYQKANNTLSTYNWSVPSALMTNTTYYARVRSTKNGYSTVISFTTNSTSMAPVVTVPTDGATNVSSTPTITFTSNSTGNSPSSLEYFSIEISQNANFSAAQGSPAYQKNFWYTKSSNALISYNWLVSSALPNNTLYYARAYSTKNGYSNTITFTTTNVISTPSVTAPAHLSTNVSVNPTISFSSSSTGNSVSSPDNLLIEISQSPSFNIAQGSPAYQRNFWYQKTNNVLTTYNWNVPASLVYNTTYYVRALSNKNGYSPVVSFTTAQPPATYLNLVDGISALTDDVYGNKAILPLTALAVTGATQYNWEFDVEGDFTSPEYTTTSGTNVLDLDVKLINSGAPYWVRVQAVNMEVPFQTTMSASTPHRFYNALHPIKLEAPTGSIDRVAFKMWTTNVANGLDFVFQMDDDEDFSSPFSNVCSRLWANATYPGVSGNVFLANKDWYDVTGFTVSANPITHKVFDAPACVGNATYYVRVMAANPNQGYFGPVLTLLVNTPGGKYAADDNQTITVYDQSVSSVYPTVFDNQLNIRLADDVNGSATVSLVDMYGKVVLESVAEQQNFVLDIPSSVANGTYLVRIMYDGNMQTLKVIKQ